MHLASRVSDTLVRFRLASYCASFAHTIVATLNAVPGPVAACFQHDTLAARVLRPLINRLLPTGPTWVVIRSGYGKGLHLLIHAGVEKFYWTGMHERPVQQAMSRVLKPGTTFWDIGAHVGFFSMIASRLVGASGYVHAFEPIERNRDRLLAAISMNGVDNVTVHNFALAAKSGQAVLYDIHGSSLMWTLVPQSGEQGGLAVRCCTLDDAAESARPPDLIKVDAEGAEVDVLRGGLNLLSTARPSLIVEFSNDALLGETRDLLPFYTFERLTPRHWLLRA